MHWRRKWQPTPVFLPGESQGQRNLVGCRLGGHTESDTTEVTQQRGYLFRKFQTRSAYIVAVFFSYLIFMYFNAVRKLTENDVRQGHTQRCLPQKWQQYNVMLSCLPLGIWRSGVEFIDKNAQGIHVLSNFSSTCW